MSGDEWVDRWEKDASGYPKPSSWDNFQQYFKRNSKNLKWIAGIIIGITIAIIHK